MPHLGKNNYIFDSKLVELSNYICQLTKHHGFEMNSSLSKFIGYIIMKDLPNEVKMLFYRETGTLDPDFDIIMKNHDQVERWLLSFGWNNYAKFTCNDCKKFCGNDSDDNCSKN